MNSPFSALLCMDSCSSLEAAFKKKSKVSIRPISGCHGLFLPNAKRFHWKKHNLFLLHVFLLWYFQKEWVQRPFPYVLAQLCPQFLATVGYGTLSKVHNPISNISHLPKNIRSDSWEITKCPSSWCESLPALDMIFHTADELSPDFNSWLLL